MSLGVAGDRAGGPGGGFDDHVAELYGPLVRFCRRITQDVDPEDLAQEALLRAWPSYVEGRDMWPLVVTIARRIAIDEHRRTVRGQVRNHVEAAVRPSHAPTPEETLEQREEAVLARRALDQLPPRYQRLIRLRDIDERSYMDIAQLEGTTLAVARSTLRRARAALRTAYGRASEGAAAVFGLPEWMGRRTGRLQATLSPLGQQGLATLAGAVAVIAVVAGVSGTDDSATLRTTPAPAAANAGGGASGRDTPTGTAPSGLIVRTGTGTDIPGPVTVPPVERVRPDKVVGPVGIGGNDYGRDRTEDAELKIEFTDHAGHVVVGVYASPKALLENPTEPLPE